MRLAPRLPQFLTRQPDVSQKQVLSPVDDRGWTRLWSWIIHEAFAGAWQRNIEIRTEDVVTFFAVYACISLIARDIGKMRLRLVLQNDGIWEETENPAFSPVLRKPNHYQNHIQFKQWWVTSKLIHGNTYVLKARDDRTVVRRLYILDPNKVKPYVAPDGSVFYLLEPDNLSRLDDARLLELPEGHGVFAPASEIIHDIEEALYHPLVGVSPIHACGLAALQGLKIQRNSYRFFENFSRPAGILTAPGAISDESAARIKEYWDTNFSGDNIGKVAVLGDDLKYQAMSITARDAELIAQLKWTAENVCAVFHVPPYKIGLGAPPSYNNVQALNLEYYNQALGNPIESMELALDEGLGLFPDKIQTERGPVQYGTELEADAALLRMDTATAVSVEAEKIKAGFGTPNESRRRFDLRPVEGGDTPYMQQQNYALQALARRDAAQPPPPTPGQPAPTAGSAAARRRPVPAAAEQDFEPPDLSVIDAVVTKTFAELQMHG